MHPHPVLLVLNIGGVKTIDEPKPFLSFAARIADGLDLFKHIIDHGAPISSKELASISKGEELLIGTYRTLALPPLQKPCKTSTNLRPRKGVS